MAVILTVEDEALLSEWLGQVLRDAGYQVIATLNADEAIAVLEAHDDIRLVITDINMPGSMDGLKLASAVRRKWPPIDIVIVTGDGRPGAHQMPARSRFVPKPYAPDHILAAVRSFG
jgi:two-component system, response regulator PdtaR